MEKFVYDSSVLDSFKSVGEMITPVKAAEYLALNKNNRKLNEATVERYVNMMSKGEWIMNGEPICFDRYGNLVNGQHRLTAIIRFGGGGSYECIKRRARKVVSCL